jgi:hypothetical protein
MRKSLIGEEFGKLTVIGYEGVKNKNSYWKCKCECGNETVICRPNLLKAESCGCLISTSLIGQRFNELIVIESAGKKDGTTYWVCKCDCGKIVVVKRGHLVEGEGTRTCGCSRRGKKSGHWTGYGDISGGFYHKIQECAKKRNIVFDVGIEYLWDLFQKQEGRCALSGEKLEIPTDSMAWRSQSRRTASLDRIDSSVGYIEGNLQWVHKDCQMMKWKFSQNNFVSMCEKIANYQGKANELKIPILAIDDLKKIL